MVCGCLLELRVVVFGLLMILHCPRLGRSACFVVGHMIALSWVALVSALSPFVLASWVM